MTQNLKHGDASTHVCIHVNWDIVHNAIAVETNQNMPARRLLLIRALTRSLAMVLDDQPDYGSTS